MHASRPACATRRDALRKQRAFNSPAPAFGTRVCFVQLCRFFYAEKRHIIFHPHTRARTLSQSGTMAMPNRAAKVDGYVRIINVVRGRARTHV